MATYLVSFGAERRVLNAESEADAVLSFIAVLRCLGKIESQYSMQFLVRRLEPERQRVSGVWMINLTTNEPVMIEKSIA